mmetsp:Transcript_31918/g.77367  ORF Transcript_31918/g.77367 Transcript_31918/m.77367 type:complete len:125 (-) Transcript_31918:1287-1661(-)
MDGPMNGPTVCDYIRNKNRFPTSIIRKPTKQNLSENKKLRYTVWTYSCGYDNDGWHSSGDPPDMVFNSSFTSLEQANTKRAEFVFYCDNPWGLAGLEEIGPVETDDTTSTGFRFLECCPDDSER